jgi:hypothetical protein
MVAGSSPARCTILPQAVQSPPRLSPKSSLCVFFALSAAGGGTAKAVWLDSQCRARPVGPKPKVPSGIVRQCTPRSRHGRLNPRRMRKGTTREKTDSFRFIDLFAGIGGLRIGFERIGGTCVFTSEWNKYSQQTYLANFGTEHPINGDITQIKVEEIPAHDVLLAGFPCQPRITHSRMVCGTTSRSTRPSTRLQPMASDSDCSALTKSPRWMPPIPLCITDLSCDRSTGNLTFLENADRLYAAHFERIRPAR